MKTIDIIIVNWNAGNQLVECIESIMQSDKNGFEILNIIVVDNASTDNSLNSLKKYIPLITVIKNKKNIGFGAACNLGANGSIADYLLFLNPDTVLFKKSLEIPINYLEQNLNRNTAVCSIMLINEKGQINKTCTKLPKPKHFLYKIIGIDRLFPKYFDDYFMKKFDHRSNKKVDHVIGAFYLVRKNIFFNLNGFDTKYFVYLEDLDLSNRIIKSGYKIQYLADAQAFHRGGGTSENIKAIRLYYSLESKLIYSYKHFDKLNFLILFIAIIFIEPLTRIILALMHYASRDTKETIEAYYLLYKNIPKNIKNMTQKSKVNSINKIDLLRS